MWGFGTFAALKQNCSETSLLKNAEAAECNCNWKGLACHLGAGRGLVDPVPLGRCLVSTMRANVRTGVQSLMLCQLHSGMTCQ